MTQHLPPPGSTARTRLRRLPERAVEDRQTAYAILDAALVGHIGVVDGEHPLSIPVAIARDGDRVLFHGSTGSRAFRALADGSPTSLTVMILDGLVLARSAFESSMNYRSVMVLGVADVVGEDDKEEALRVLTERLTPGRWPHLRPMLRKEVAATLVLSLPLDELSVKVRSGGPEDSDEADYPVWAGHVPLHTVVGEPVAATDVPGGALPGRP